MPKAENIAEPVSLAFVFASHVCPFTYIYGASRRVLSRCGFPGARVTSADFLAYAGDLVFHKRLQPLNDIGGRHAGFLDERFEFLAGQRRGLETFFLRLGD